MRMKKKQKEKRTHRGWSDWSHMMQVLDWMQENFCCFECGKDFLAGEFIKYRHSPAGQIIEIKHLLC